MKTIEITITPSGETTVETKGFSGSECREVSRFLETALGAKSTETFTSEFYENRSQAGIQTQQEK